MILDFIYRGWRLGGARPCNSAYWPHDVIAHAHFKIENGIQSLISMIVDNNTITISRSCSLGGSLVSDHSHSYHHDIKLHALQLIIGYVATGVLKSPFSRTQIIQCNHYRFKIAVQIINHTSTGALLLATVINVCA